jgi:HAE1 family hydrophobic/amphiphilic exporter-1
VRRTTRARVFRVDGQLASITTGRLLGEDTNAHIQELRAEISDLGLQGVEVSYEGEASFIQDMFQDLGMAMLVAIALVYLVLVLFFGSITQPITILAPILFSTIGSLLALLITGRALGLPAMIGQLLLIGIVVANSILIVDTALRLRRHGTGRNEALEEAARLRVRPVLMTAVATIAALTPLAVGLSGEGGIISQSLGTVVIGGLATATLLTLVIVPAVFTIFDRGRPARRQPAEVEVPRAEAA